MLAAISVAYSQNISIQKGRCSLIVVKKLERILENACAINLVIITIVVLLGVFTRYVLHNALSWTEEMTRFLIVFLGLVGAALALGKGSHSSIDVIVNISPAWLQLIFKLISHVTIAVFASVMVIFGIKLAYTSGAHAEILPIPMWIPLSSVPLSGVIMLYYSLRSIIQELKMGVCR